MIHITSVYSVSMSTKIVEMSYNDLGVEGCEVVKSCSDSEHDTLHAERTLLELHYAYFVCESCKTPCPDVVVCKMHSTHFVCKKCEVSPIPH